MSEKKQEYQQAFPVMSLSGISQKVGFLEDIDIENIQPGKKGIFLLFRDDLNADGTSKSDRIDFSEKEESSRTGGSFLTNPPQQIYNK